MPRLAVLVLVCALGGTARAEEAAHAAADLAALIAGLAPCDAARAHCFGIQLHVTVTGDGVIAKPDWLATQLAAANRQFAALGVAFQVVGIDALPAGAAHIATRADRDELATGRLGSGVIHAFIVGQLDDIDRDGQVIRGVTWHTREDGRKYILVSTAAPERVLAHELGHFFGLPHSSYAISIMNKRERKRPPPEQRRFADVEIAAMRPVLLRLVRDKVISELGK
ncbi:MAG TPA: matrixin family metalloprotease [Kofleriaceae bacterium]|nr:matrixin family metalloprotease [Kofleriaceae bacterium]